MEPGHAEHSSPEKYVKDICGAFGATVAQEFEITKSKGCYYTNTPDENYIVDQVSNNQWVIAGLSGHGFKFAPALAHHVISSIKRRKKRRILRPFALKRFRQKGSIAARTRTYETDIAEGKSWKL